MYERLIKNLEPVLKEMNVGSELPLTNKELVEVVKKTVDGKRFYDFSELVTNAYLDYLTGRTDKLTYSYDLRPVRSKLADELTVRLQKKYNALPICQANQLSTWEISSTLPNCRLSNESQTDTNRNLANLSQQISQMVPNQLKVVEAPRSVRQWQPSVVLALSIIKGVWLVTLLVVGLFLLISRSRAFVTLAWSFILVGIFEVGFGLIAWDWLGRLISENFTNGSESQLAPVAIDLSAGILEIFKSTLGNISVIMLIVGVTSLLLAIIYRHKSKPEAAASVKLS